MDLYKTTALYKQNMSEIQQKSFFDYYRKVFSEYDIKTIHDITIGAGGTTLPLAKLGYQVTGSDLSENLLEKAKENFMANGYNVQLKVGNFLELDQDMDSKVDCIISTGNSVPHVANGQVEKLVKLVHGQLNDGGLFYIDLRNWDKLLEEKQVFSAMDPLVMNENEHVCVYRICNWHDDDSVEFSFVTSISKAGKHVEAKSITAPTYYPLKRQTYKEMLEKNGFEVVAYYDMDDLWHYNDEKDKKCGDFESDYSVLNWYSVLAKKI